MRTATSLLVGTFLLAGTASGADTAQKGIELSDMDRKADPCTDFFEFANGAWRAANPIPASLPRWSRRWAAGESTKEQLKQLLDETTAAGKAAPGSVEQLIGDYYGACMDEATVNRLGAQPLEPLLVEIRAMKSSADVSNMIGRFHRMGIGVPFFFGGESDAHNPNDVIAKVYASGLGMPDRDYYVKTEDRFKDARAKYLAHVAAIFRLAAESDARAKAEADTVLRMETKLAEASLDNVALRDPKATDHKTTFADLQKMTPHFPWAPYYKTAGVTPGDLNVAEPKFLAEFDRQLASTPLADWKVYLQWHLLNAAASSLSDPFVQEDWEFNGKFLSGAKELKPRWKRCVESTDRQLGEALGRKYVEKYFPPEAKARMQEMVANLRLAMKETIEGLDWMSSATKKRALEKLSTFNPKVGYPDRWKDYSKVTIRRGTFWEDVVAGRQFNVEDVRGTIGKPVDRGRWGMTPPTSDAYYNPLLNELVFPAGILQPPAFSMQNNDAVNYGAIGVVIGHEISHGFDDEGAQFDAQGRLNNWWTDEDLKRFQDKAACVVRQFDGYFVEPGIHHNGKLVLGESIGDLAGAKIAYRAFQISQKGKPPLPDVEGFSPDQQFFIAWGQFRGDAVRPEFARTMVQGDPHPIGKYRVIGPLSNLTEFQKAFECKPGSAMVRPGADRCEVW
jgi:endothelin-converting enzyme/putative endopeptidase